MSIELIERVTREGNPLIDGEQVTFVWHGDKAPVILGDFSDDEYHPITMKDAGDNSWIYQTDFPQDAYVEYFFVDPETRVRLPDPFNIRQVTNGMGDMNHYFYMPEAKVTRLLKRNKNVPQGKVTGYKLDLGFFYGGITRKIWLYKPPVDGPVPLLLIYDGDDFHRRGRITQVVDNLIAEGRMQPVAMAMLAHGKRQRFLEYGCSDITIGMILEVILPFAQKHLDLVNLEESPGAYGIMGASMGGLMSLYTALRIPQVFGKVLSLSGAFGMDQEFIVYDLVRCHPPKPLRIWMAAGRYEWLLSTNRKMHLLLDERGYTAEYMEFNGGHNYTCWRNVYYKGLEYLFEVEE